MFDFNKNRNFTGCNNSIPRPSLYCVWIRAHEGENAPLIRVWIDPAMTMFESQATVHEPDLAAARAGCEQAEASGIGPEAGPELPYTAKP
jgi:hypothetical protein